MGFGSLFKRNKKDKSDEDKSHILIVEEECDGCEKCIIACPNNVLHLVNSKSSVRNHQVCKHCKVCMAIYPNDCIAVN